MKVISIGRWRICVHDGTIHPNHAIALVNIPDLLLELYPIGFREGTYHHLNPGDEITVGYLTEMKKPFVPDNQSLPTSGETVRHRTVVLK